MISPYTLTPSGYWLAVPLLRAFIAASLKGVCSLSFKKKFNKVTKKISQ
jgi:hypothetical protein